MYIPTETKYYSSEFCLNNIMSLFNKKFTLVLMPGHIVSEAPNRHLYEFKVKIRKLVSASRDPVGSELRCLQNVSF